MIVGILVLAVVFALFFVVNSQTKEALPPTESLTPETAAIKQFVESCLQSVSKAGLLEISKRGGYFSLPEIHKNESDFVLPYYFSDGTSTVPSLETVEHQLALYVNKELPVCVGSFAPFKEQGYTITSQLPDTTVELVSGKMTSTVTFPLTITQRQTESQKEVVLREFTATVPYDFTKKLKFAHEFVVQQQLQPDYLPLTYLLDQAQQEGFTVEILYFNDTTVGFQLLFTDSPLYDPFIYSFAIKYPELPELKDSVVIDDMVPDVVPEVGYFVVRKGEIFRYQIPLVNGENVRFYGFDSTLYVNEQTGELEIDTAALPEGDTTYTIMAIDQDGQSDIETITIKVEP